MPDIVKPPTQQQLPAGVGHDLLHPAPLFRCVTVNVAMFASRFVFFQRAPEPPYNGIVGQCSTFGAEIETPSATRQAVLFPFDGAMFAKAVNLNKLANDHEILFLSPAHAFHVAHPA